MTYAKRARWKDPASKLIPHQMAFTAPPHDFDAAPADFLSIAPETVGVHGRMLHQTAEFDALTGRPIVASDVALCWWIMKTLGIRPTGPRGRLLDTL